MIHRVKGLDLADRVPEEVGMEVCNTVQEALTKIIPKKKKYKKAKWLSEEALQIVKEIRKLKGKGGRAVRCDVRGRQIVKGFAG